MQDLQNAVNTAFASIVQSGAIQLTIEKKLLATVESIIDNELRSYSDFGQALSKQVKSALQVDFSNLGLPGYNDLILKIIRSQVAQQLEGQLTSQVEAQMKELLAPAPSEIKLSELVADFIKHNSERYDRHQIDSEGITLIVEEDRSHSTVFHHVYLDKEEGKDKYQCSYQIDVIDGRVYRVQIDRVDPDKKLFAGPFYDFGRQVFQLYAAGTKLIVDGDEDSIETHYPYQD